MCTSFYGTIYVDRIPSIKKSIWTSAVTRIMLAIIYFGGNIIASRNEREKKRAAAAAAARNG